MENSCSFTYSTQRQFLCCVPVKKIQWKHCLDNLSWDDQKALLDETVNLKILETYPLQVKYVIRFLRHIIDTLERNNQEIHDDLYTTLCSYQSQSDDATEFSYKHYQLQNRISDSIETVILKENHNKISQGTTGLGIWESALALSEYAIANSSEFRGKRILELGAGTGLSSFIIAKCCAPHSITLSDGNDKVIDYLNENIRINFESSGDGRYKHDDTTVDVAMIDWNAPLDESIKDLNRFDMIVAADVIFDNSLFRPLCQTLTSLFHRSKHCKQFLLVNAVRNPDTEREFLELLGEYNFEYVEHKIVPPHHLYWEQSEISPIKIYLIRPIVDIR